jgi:dsDNA-binding SOS-regulon protein
MKAIFEDEATSLTVGVQGERIVFVSEYESEAIDTELSLPEAYKLQRWLNTCIAEIEEKERQKLPLWKRLF